MTAVQDETPLAPGEPARKRANHPLARVWRSVRKPLAQSRFVKAGLASSIAGVMRVIERTNPLAPGSDVLAEVFRDNPNTIYALWHGQHILAPALNPRWHDLVAMFSRSADAELNAQVAERLGLKTVRGSGGREGTQQRDKGGARALIALKKALDEGKSVSMIADIPHGTPRQAGLGIITLARISGRPIIGIAVATSRRKVLEKSWDRTAINLPFGRMGVRVTPPLTVPPRADEGAMEAARAELTGRLNDATVAAYELADGRG